MKIDLQELRNTSQKKSGFVTLIGRPNVGKSTLMNHLIGQKIAITSKKPQTTRNRIQTVYTDQRGQIVFLDTPGIHKAKNKLGEYMVSAAERTLNEVDVILWLVEPTTFIGAGERHIVEQLKRVKTPVVLIINKIDTVKKEEILTFMDAYRKIYDFAEIIPVSALRAQNLDTVLSVIYRYLPYGPMFYDEDTVTDQPQRQIVAEIIREKALRCLDEEIPHGIAVAIDSMKERPLSPGRNSSSGNKGTAAFTGKGTGKAGEDGPVLVAGTKTEPDYMYDIDATIICERESHKGIIIGKGGSMLKRIGSDARRDMEHMLEAKVNLQLWVKVKKDWRDSDFMIKNFGYDKKEL